ncbi:hypothetical protein Nepgr_018912 [Nepenthes gracilis]|uniref:Uncharacterized protein n=1 Tax=Nepenthes gracilis TaxID=150966 RepID=A0AAD3XUS9_NEPGR|nr:hypothetical protein Nepgr_018912 [Nepenthes gracilis]
MGKRSKELLQLEHMDPSLSRESTETPTAQLPQSQVLGKVKDFLGVISEANKNLQLSAKDKPEDYDIEVLTGNESHLIEMDLMLGIADLHTPEAVAAADAAIAGHQSVLDLPADSSSSESKGIGEDDEDDAEQTCSPVRHQNSDWQQGDTVREKFRSHQNKKRQKIVELS